MVTRRTVLKFGVAGSLGYALPLSISSQVYAASAPPSPPLAPFQDLMPIPPVLDCTAGGTFNISAAAGLHRFHASLPASPAWGYGGVPYMGPTIITKRNVPITLNVTNNLGAHLLPNALDYDIHGAVSTDLSNPRISTHLHGGNTEPGSDGHPDDVLYQGQTKSHYFHNDQEAATLWYHDHAIGITRLNIYAGLAGMYLLRDDNELSRNLPGGPYEIPLIIQDKAVDSSGKMTYPDAPLAATFGGDVAVVNGKIWPYFNVKRGWYRFRIVNACNARTMQLYLGGKTMYQIGSDGGLLNAPIAMTSITLAPAERADILVNFTSAYAGQSFTLNNIFMGGPWRSLSNIMQFRVQSASGFAMTFPSALRAPIRRMANPVKVRNLVLVQKEMASHRVHLLNNLMWDDTTHIETPTSNTLEQWNIINLTMDMHPIHVHMTQFQVLNRQNINVSGYNLAFGEMEMGAGPWPAPAIGPYLFGSAQSPPANEMGWKDVAQCQPSQVTRLMIPFGPDIPGSPIGRAFTGEYVWHCHVLEHEDHEMMLRFKLI